MNQELLEQDIERINERMYSLFESVNEIYSAMELFIKGPSKRIRSKLGLLYLKVFGKTINTDVIDMLAAGELIHNASLIHDDIVDFSMIRRGEPTIESKISTKAAVLSGDYLLSKSGELLLNINNPELIKILFDCLSKMTEAEITEQSYSGKIPPKEVYIEICTNKTAILFSTILKSVALISGLDVCDAEKLGKIFGIVFQVRNDLEPQSAQTDKSNSIYTALDIFGIEKTMILIDNYKKELGQIIQDYPNNEYRVALEDLIEAL